MMEDIWSLYKKVVYRVGIGDFKKWSKMPLSMVQMRVLIYLSIEQPVSIGDIAEHMDSSFPNMAGILKRLEKQGLILRSVDKNDRRITIIETTPKAKQMLDEALEHGWRNLQFALQAMTSEERAVVFEAFEILERSLPTVGFPNLQNKDD